MTNMMKNYKQTNKQTQNHVIILTTYAFMMEAHYFEIRLETLKSLVQD